MIIQAELDSEEDFQSYRAGVSPDDCKEYICSTSQTPELKLPQENEREDVNDNISVEMSLEASEFQISIKSHNLQAEGEDPIHATKSKEPKVKKAKKKNRSYSESHCEELKAEQEELETALKQSTAAQPASSVKSRTISESSNDDHHTESFVLKSILKRHSSYDRQMSECSNEDCVHAGSVDLGIGSFTSIPEESDRELSESVRKTVRFDKHLCRKLLFR